MKSRGGTTRKAKGGTIMEGHTWRNHEKGHGRDHEGGTIMGGAHSEEPWDVQPQPGDRMEGQGGTRGPRK
jgi:hypothetical protein